MPAELYPFLNINPEVYKYYNENDIHKILTLEPLKYLDFIKTAFNKIANNKVNITLPSKQIFEDNENKGDFRIMPCIVREKGKVFKTIKLVGTNVIQKILPNQITVGKVFCLHPEENYITHIFEACLFSSARTAILGLLAACELLAEIKELKDLSIIGAGRIGFYTAYYFAYLKGVEKISIYDLNPDKLKEVISKLKILFPKITFLPFVYEKNNIFIDSDAIVLATSSNKPVLKKSRTNTELIISLGADTTYQRELDEDFAESYRIYIDSMDCINYGDMKSWMQKGVIESSNLIEFVRVFKEEKPGAFKKIFISTGSALMDNLTIQYILSLNKDCFNPNP